MARAALGGLALLAASLAAWGGEMKAYRHPDGIFECRVPAGWEAELDEDTRGVVLSHPEPGKHRAREVEIAVVPYREGASYASIEEFLEANGGEHALPVQVAGREVRRYERTRKLEDLHQGRSRNRQSYALVPVEGGFYLLVYTVRDRRLKGRGAYERFLGDFERLLKSFKPVRSPWKQEP